MAAVLTILGARDPRLEERVRASGRITTVTWLSDLSTLLDPGAGQPDVLLVDVRQDGKLPGSLPALKRQHPSTNVMLLGAAVDPALMLDGMRAGVTEFIAEPLDQTDFDAAITRLLGQRKQVVGGPVFAFVGAKGGVGATTVAVNVATALAKAIPDSTLLIDLNVACGDASVFLGAEPRFSVVDALENIHRLDAAFFGGLVVRSKSGVDLLGASGRPVTAALEAARIRALLDFASQTRRYTVVDVPRSDTAALESLEMATKIVLVANQELATVRSASRMAATLRQRYGQDRLSLVVTRTDKRAEIGFEDVERTVGIDVRHAFPSDYRMALQGMNKGRPVVLDTQNELSRAFSAFARELAGIPEAEKAQSARTGSVFGRLSLRRA